MMNKKYMKIAAVVTAMSVMLGCAACGSKTEETQTAQSAAVQEKPEAQKEEAQETETTDITEGTEAADAAENTEETDTVSSTGTVSVFDGTLSDEWTDMQFAFDGNAYQLPVSYHDLEAAGWTFDLADYGYADGYVMNPGDKTYGTIDLTNPAYDEDLSVQVGFINNGTTAVDILDCDIWSFDLDTCHGFKQLDTYPDMVIAKGIGIGSSLEDVVAAFGESDDIYDAADYGYVTYNYNVDYTYYLKMTIYKDKGVTSIEINSYE